MRILLMEINGMKGIGDTGRAICVSSPVLLGGNQKFCTRNSTDSGFTVVFYGVEWRKLNFALDLANTVVHKERRF